MSEEVKSPEDTGSVASHCSHVGHTPGPWQVLHDSARGKPRCLVLDDRGLEIAQVNHHRLRYCEDARLLAAAPELLAACRDMIEAMDDYECSVDDPPTPKHREMMLRAMKAVEKATKQVV